MESWAWHSHVLYSKAAAWEMLGFAAEVIDSGAGVSWLKVLIFPSESSEADRGFLFVHAKSITALIP